MLVVKSFVLLPALDYRDGAGLHCDLEYGRRELGDLRRWDSLRLAIRTVVLAVVRAHLFDDKS